MKDILLLLLAGTVLVAGVSSKMAEHPVYVKEHGKSQELKLVPLASFDGSPCPTGFAKFNAFCVDID